jgi:starch synthase
LVDQGEYFRRPDLYGESGEPFADNCERFVFFCRSVLESIRLLDLQVDLIHNNDWQTGLIPALLKIEYAGAPAYENIASLLTIHNLAYQGNFWHWDMLLTGLDWKHFNWQEMEFYGRLNLLKTGIVFADTINTVSPTYAAEIQTAQHGCGLEGVLKHRSNVLSGILNGIDRSVWNPATDPHLAVNYDASSWQQGKAACKVSVQAEFRFDASPDTPLIGIIGRLVAQKGWSLILPVLRQWLESIDAQWIVLGTGDPQYHWTLESLHRQYREKLALELGFSNKLAHRIESAADIFLMPSQYEPCGLNQLYSLAYGAVPVVRHTGGLADTVVNTTKETIADGSATGFSFEPFTAEAMESALARAVWTYLENRPAWNRIVDAGMRQDWSWSNSARKYERLYGQTIAKKLDAHQPV